MGKGFSGWICSKATRGGVRGQEEKGERGGRTLEPSNAMVPAGTVEEASSGGRVSLSVTGGAGAEHVVGWRDEGGWRKSKRKGTYPLAFVPWVEHDQRHTTGLVLRTL